MMYEYWLAKVRPLSARKKRKLKDAYGSARAVYYIEEKDLHRLGILTKQEIRLLCRKTESEKQLEEEWKKLEMAGIQMIPYGAPEYPQRLTQIQDPPFALFVKGDLPPENQPAVAIVGARKCTPYGEQMALEYGEAMAGAGIAVISGMARGIDGAGQRGALNGGGRTYGVLGCGVDICYPREHIGLYTDIMKNGGILSERIPGEPPLPAYFPERNRIISGLADVGEKKKRIAHYGRSGIGTGQRCLRPAGAGRQPSKRGVSSADPSGGRNPFVAAGSFGGTGDGEDLHYEKI